MTSFAKFVFIVTIATGFCFAVTQVICNVIRAL